ncbi:ATP-binding protein [Pseudomonas koreensis]|uniref:ATP-binding protein n=1 Tax=Pseudomonas koreensis TaxID=198620 RepID=UPI003F8724F4
MDATSELGQPFVPSVAALDLRLSHLLVQLATIDERVQEHLTSLSEEGISGASALLNQEVFEHLGARHWAPHVPDWESLQSWPHALEDSRLEHLVRRFGLSGFERDLLLLCVLPVLDARYRMVYGFLQGDHARNSHVTRELALKLLCVDLIDQIECHVYFASDAPLLREGLLYWKHHDRAGVGVNGSLQLSSAVYFYLLGHDNLNPVLAANSQWLPEPATRDPFADFTAKLTQLLRAHTSPLLLLQGAPGSGRSETVARATAALNIQALCLDLAALPNEDAEALEVLDCALRDVKLRGGCLVLRDIASLVHRRRELFAQLDARLRIGAPPIICLVDTHAAPTWLGERPHLVWEHPQIGADTQVELLRARVPELAERPENELAALVKRYHLTKTSLPLVLEEADHYRKVRDPFSSLNEADLRQACRLRSQQHFGDLARRTEPQRTFADLVVGAELTEQLQEVVGAIRQRAHVLDQGFARKVGYGTGISALFHGDSGTGKTMAAEVLAHTLGVDLITIDLSTVVNKYIGETEKNLARIFDLAERDSGVLLFDEADALFGKRSETKDANDRNANIQVSYLLQRLEKYPGLVILSSNNRTHLDDAFSRRITFMLRFPAPDAVLREKMWRDIWPSGSRLATDIDFAALARRAEISGANIRNVALAASWLAADEKTGEIKAHHIERALKRELGKIGRLLL